MDALEAIVSRRNVRAFTPSPVPAHLITELLQAAMAAPSAGKEQPWHFVVITARETLNIISEIHPDSYSHMLQGAQTAILVCGDVSLKSHKQYWVQDCAAATENIILAAHALGLGGIWVGVKPEDERIDIFRELLDIPQGVVPFALVAIGYPAEHTDEIPRFNSERVHYEQWPHFQ